MDTDEKIKNDETSAGDASGGEAPETEELIELVDEVPADDESLEPEPEEDTEEEPIELTDEVAPEVDSPPEQEEGIEPSDLVEESELAELSEENIIIPEPEEDTLIEDLGIELTEKGSELSEELESEEPDVEFEKELSPSEGRVLEQAILDKLSGEKLEEIVTTIVKRTIVDKVERILLEAAETAIAEEIERLKQAL